MNNCMDKYIYPNIYTKKQIYMQKSMEVDYSI